MSDVPDRPVNYLGKQACDIIDEDTDWAEFARELDTERLERRDGLAEGSYSSRTFSSVFLTYLWATVEKESCSGIPKQLDNPLHAHLGFTRMTYHQKARSGQLASTTGLNI